MGRAGTGGERGQSPWFFRPEWGQSGDSHRVWSGGDNGGTVTISIRVESREPRVGTVTEIRVGTVTVVLRCETIGGTVTVVFFVARTSGDSHRWFFSLQANRPSISPRGSGDRHEEPLEAFCESGCESGEV